MKLVLRLIQNLSSLFLGNKKNYLNTPDEILSWIQKDKIAKLWHILPSLVLAIIISIKLLPEVWTGYATELEKNGMIVPLVLLIFLIPILILNGVIIEKILIKKNAGYRIYIESQNK